MTLLVKTRPLLFVAMPYGVKQDPASRIKVDFDAIYQEAVRPAALAAGVEVVRADEELVGGFIHLPMFERLLLSEIVLADLTFASPNVLYELGIRHATRPRATVLVYAKIGQLPFDVAPIRAVPYELGDRGQLSYKCAQALSATLEKQLRVAAEPEGSSDSPLFQLIRDYPGVHLPHDATEVFRDRVKRTASLSEELRRTGRRGQDPAAQGKLRDLARLMMPYASAPSDLVLDLFLAYRDAEMYEEMVDLVGELPDELAQHPVVRQQFAFALNRRAHPGDDDQAVEVLESVVEQHGPSAETYGLLGRVHKDRYDRLRSKRPAAARRSLEAAIEAYEAGLRADPRDYYPGINAVTLLLLKGDDEARRHAREDLAPVVAFAVSCRGGMGSSDYWDLATLVELAVVRGDELSARRASDLALRRAPLPWMRETTVKNLGLLREATGADPAVTAWLDEIVTQLLE